MGNRGLLHDENREIVRQFKVQRWITCCLEFRGRTRSVMSPRRYTELFFLDEAVAFAAGHRPCAECRRERFAAFQQAWKRRGKEHSNAPASALQIDAELHRSRIDRAGRKVTYEAELNALPNGCFIEIGGSPLLIWNNTLFSWTPDGYARKEQQAGGLWVTVLTPQPIIECFVQGYEPQVHNSVYPL
jgi:hypothetical protein